MNDTSSSQQDRTLADAYQYNYSYIEPIAMVDKLPQNENFSVPWLVLTGIQALKLALNTLISNQGDRGQKGDEDTVKEFLRQKLLQTLNEEGTSFKSNLVNTLISLLPQILLQGGAPATTEVEVAKMIAMSLQQSDVSSVEARMGISQGIGTTLQKAGADISQGIGTTLQSTDTASARAKIEVSQGIETALQKSLPGIPSNEAEVERFVTSNLVKILGTDFLKLFAKNVLDGLKEKSPTGRASSLEDYRKLFAYIALPEIANTFQNDEVFAYMRVAGPNPVIIERMTAPDARFPVTEEQYKAVMGDSDSLPVAIAEGRVYWLDYAILDGALNGTFGTQPQTQKYLYAPLAMFAVPSSDISNRLLRPVAIQCGQKPTDYPVITPSTGADAWLMAKTVVQVADANFHEAVSHLARTHLLVGPFAIATHRQLPSNHPLFALLVPHFQGTLAINNAAQAFLVAPQGGVNDLLSSTIENSRVLAVKGLQARGFNADMLPRRLKDRGVDDKTSLPVYPYRDDGLLVWGAIRDWVAAYLGLYYGSDDAVKGDRALQNWAKELVAFDGGRLQDFGDGKNSEIETLKYLTDAVTMVIFTASAQHAAVNFPQNGIMSYAPAMPTAGYKPAQSIGTGSTQKDWFDLLPPLEQAQSQLNLLYLLGSVYFTKLGYYEDGHFTDPKVAEPLKAFQNRLTEIDTIIDRSNLERPDYTYLKPSNIPQSINI
jgi:arachidonate 15-lipoxygenase